MIAGHARIFVATAPIDFRGSFDRLAGAVRAHLQQDPLLALRLPRDPPPDADHSAGSSVGLRCWRIARGRSDLRA